MRKRTLLTVLVIVVTLLGGCTTQIAPSADDPDAGDGPDTDNESRDRTGPTSPPPRPGQLLEETNTTGG